ncbi:MAG TPA: FAD-dependent oxidoreductase [bacterium]|nr:FAD-dependent oxidoreductase [bacterium]
MQNILIIGGGIAGTTAAEEIRKRDASAHITILSEEQHVLYSRVLLPHYVKDKIVRDKVFLRTGAWYLEKNIELMFGVRALEIDVKNQFVRTSEDRELPFDKLLLTTGGEISLFQDDLRGISYLHTLDDADHLKALVGEVRTLKPDERQAAVYGGGFIACEYANVFKHFEIPFCIIMRGSGFWSRLLSEHSQKVIRNFLDKQGVPLYTNEPMPELLGEDDLRGLKLRSGGEISARILGVGIGMKTESSLVADAGIPTNHGILANEYLETTIPNVYAAGDVAEFEDTMVKRQVQYSNWMNAQMQGRVVGATMAGERTAFKLVSSYATNLLGLHMVFLGDVNREHADEIRVGLATDDASQELFFRNGMLVGAVLIGDISPRATLTQAIGKSL